MIQFKVKKIISLILFLSLSAIIFSQSNYISGQIINLNGDTINGFVDYRDWSVTPMKIRFKENKKGKVVNYSPKTIKKLTVKGSAYISAIVDLETSSRRNNELDDKPELMIRRDTVFLQPILIGEKKLYHHKYWNGTDNFFINVDSKLTLLEYKKYVRILDSKDIITEVKNYILQLKEYFKDCEQVQGELLTLNYEMNELRTVFNNHAAACSNQDIQYRKEKEKVNISYGVFGGGSLTNLKITSSLPAFNYMTMAGYSNSLNFAIGAKLDFILPKIRRKIVISNELMFTQYGVEGEYLDFTRENNFTVTNTEINYGQINLNSLLQYRHLLKEGNLFFNGGVSFGVIVNALTVNKRTDHVTFHSTNSVELGPAIKFTRGYEFGGIIGMGFKWNKFWVEARYENGNGVSRVVPLKIGTNKFFLLFGYEL